MLLHVFDIECDGLKATKIHCLSYVDMNDMTKKVKTLTSYKDIKEFILNADCLIGHNITLYDVPTIERLIGIKVRARLVDTLALSWYCQPDRPRHGLASYGVEYGLLKKEIEDWEGLDLQMYVDRCETDVRINLKVWTDQALFLKRLYGSSDNADRLIKYLAFKMDCALAQESTGWKLDVERCKKAIEQLSEDKDKKTQELQNLMPDVPFYKTRSKPKNMFLQNGKLSKFGLAWVELAKQHPVVDDTITYIGGYEKAKPSSPQQVKDFLFSLGWVPDEYKYVREDDGSMRKIPQVNTQMPGESGLSASVKLLIEKEPKLEVLEGLSVIQHRLSLLKGFLKAVDENGYVKASVQGLTNTLRFIHKDVVNLPKVGKAYGDVVRGCLIAPDDEELCGSDMSSLEDRIKQHFLMPHDPEYVQKMLADDYDPHLTLAEFAGFISAEEHKGYIKDKASFKRIKPIRDYSKNTNYACQYGATGARVALTCGISKEKGDELVENYWKLNWAIKVVANEQTYKKLGTVQNSEQLWLFNPISKLWYSLRNVKDIFSTLCQGTASYVFDTWIKYVRSRRWAMTGQFHDEGIWSIKLGFRNEAEGLLRWAIQQANEELKLNRVLDIDVQFGNNYAEIH